MEFNTLWFDTEIKDYGEMVCESFLDEHPNSSNGIPQYQPLHHF